MAMLAEPRRKVRIGPNPRGQFFLEDDDNKGRAMLSKLGWSKGEGLGRQSQGMQAPICPKIVMDGKGLGYDPKSNPWIVHNEEFSQILESLQVVTPPESNNEEATKDAETDSDTETAKKKLEKKSRSSKVRIHYHKFVKSKDVSNFSNTDLKCIFGKPKEELITKPKAIKKESGGTNEEEDDGVKTINCGSMADYFQNKMALLKQKRELETEVKVKEEKPSSDYEEGSNHINRGSMLDYFKAKMAARRLNAAVGGQDPISNGSSLEDSPSIKVEAPTEESSNDQDEVQAEPVSVGKKSKKMKRLAPDSNETNEGCGETAELDPEVPMKKSKKEKRKNQEKSTDQESDVVIKEEVCEPVEQESAASDEIMQKKSKKSKRKLNLESTPSDDASIQEDNTEEIKRPKSKKKSVDAEEAADDIVIAEKVKRKKKAKTAETELSAALEPAPAEIEEEMPRKKLKKPGNTEEELPVVVATEDSEIPVKKSKKKKSDTSEPSAVDELLLANKAQNFHKKEKRKRAKIVAIVEEFLQQSSTETMLEQVKKPKKAPKREVPDTAAEVSANNPEISTPQSASSERWARKSKRFDKYSVSPQKLQEISQQFKGSNLKEIRGYAIY